MSTEQTELLYSPYGEVSFEMFRRLRRAYADKSGMIATLDDIGMTRFPVLLRPRRFGKSTFVQMLKCFYDISYSGMYEELFSGTEVYEKNLAGHNAYHVIDFDFSGVSGVREDVLLRSFIIAVNSGINDFMVRYPDFVFRPTEAEKETPSGFIRAFVDAYKRNPVKRSLYLLIDEYDNFAHNVLSADLKLFRVITSTGGFLRDFYAAVKGGTKRYIAKTFITGVSSVSLDSLTSGFNISLNVTADKNFNNYAGFTEGELKKLIPKLVDLKSIGVTAEEVIARMKPVYDGYCFSWQASNTLFNSSMCLYYLNIIRKTGEFVAPEKYLDPASDHDGSKLRQLFDIAADDLADYVINTYLAGDDFYLEKLAENINLNQTAKYNDVQLLSMLYYLGYLTIDPEHSTSDGLMLRVPNLYMSRLFAHCTMDLKLRNSSVFREQCLDISGLIQSADDLAGFAVSCTQFLSVIFTSQVLAHMSEMALNLVLYVKLSSLREVVAELQKSLRVPGQGANFADLVITVNKGKSSECVYLIELKYIPKNDATAATISRRAQEAAGQVQTYRNALEFRGKMVKPCAMVFAGAECVHCAIQ